MLFWKNETKHKTKKLLNLCLFLIDQYEPDILGIPSCKPAIEKYTVRLLNDCKEEIAEWNDSEFDYEKMARTIIVNAAFDLLTSGKYHIGAGVLNPMSCVKKLEAVYINAMKEAVQTGEITEDELKEQYMYLRKCISEAG